MLVGRMETGQRCGRKLAVLLLCLTFCSSSVAQLEALRPYSRTCYTTLNLCFRSADRDGSYGCGICRDDIVLPAPLRYIVTEAELNTFLADDTAELSALLLPTSLYLSEGAMLSLRDAPSGRVSAVYIEDADSPDGLPIPDGGFSPSTRSPNGAFGVSSDPDYAWNPPGNGLIREEFPFPVYALPSEVIAQVLENVTRVDGLGGPFPRLELEPGGVMWSCGEDAGTCLKNGTCQPVGGHSVWIGGAELDRQREYVAVSAALDSTGFFPDLAVGAWESTGAAALIAVAELFGRYKRAQGAEPRRIPVFFGFYAESFGYAGSRRFLADVQGFNCTVQANYSEGNLTGCIEPYAPSLQFLELRNASWYAHIDIGPIGRSVDRQLYLHSDGKRDLSLVQPVLENFFGDGLTRNAALDESVGLPPSSSHAFVSELDVNSVTITDYDERFGFGLFQSMFDANISLDWDLVCSTATNLGRSLVQMTFEQDTEMEANCTLVEQMISCFGMRNFSMCAEADEYLPQDWFEYLQESLSAFNQTQAYPAVFAPLPITVQQLPSRLARQSLMLYLLGYHNAQEVTDVECTADADCSELMEERNKDVEDMAKWQKYRCARRRCVRFEGDFHQAFGTGINATDPFLNRFEVISDNADAAFVESRWDQGTGYCLQTKDSRAFGAAIVSSGIAVWIASAVLLAVASRLLRGKIPDDDPNPLAFTA